METRDPKARFSDRVEDYVRGRPRYPQGVLQVLKQEIDLQPSWVVADIGSGTGISSELFLANGNQVFGVEPNPAMRAAAEGRNRGNARFLSVPGTAEATGLDANSVDLVVVAQAFHWFDRSRSREHFATILRPPRWVVLLWNTRRTGASPFLKAYEDLLEEFGTDYRVVRHDRIGSDGFRAFFGGEYRRHVLPNQQVLDWTALKSRLLSTSYTPGPGDPSRQSMIRSLRGLFERFQAEGMVLFEYDTEIFVGRLT